MTSRLDESADYLGYLVERQDEVDRASGDGGLGHALEFGEFRVLRDYRASL